MKRKILELKGHMGSSDFESIKGTAISTAFLFLDIVVITCDRCKESNAEVICAITTHKSSLV